MYQAQGHTHTHTFLQFSCHFTATQPPEGERAKLNFTCLVRSTTVDRQPSMTPKTSMAHWTLHCSTLLVHGLLSFWDTLVTLPVTFPSKESIAFIALYLVAWVILGILMVTSNTQALQSLLVGCYPPRPRHWGFIIPPVFCYINSL